MASLVPKQLKIGKGKAAEIRCFSLSSCCLGTSAKSLLKSCRRVNAKMVSPKSEDEKDILCCVLLHNLVWLIFSKNPQGRLR